MRPAGGGSSETISKAQLTDGWNLREGPLSVDMVSKLVALLNSQSPAAAPGGDGTESKGNGRRAGSGTAAQTSKHEDDPLRVHIKNVARETDNKGLGQFLSAKFGEITEVSVKHNTRRKPGYGFVTFACAESAAQALKVRAPFYFSRPLPVPAFLKP